MRNGALGVGNHYSQVDSGSLERGAMNTGDPQFGRTCYWAEFKSPWFNKGGTGSIATPAETTDHDAGPFPQGCPTHEACGANTQFLGSKEMCGLLSDVLRGQRSKSGMAKELVVAELQKSWQSPTRESIPDREAYAHSFQGSSRAGGRAALSGLMLVTCTMRDLGHYCWSSFLGQHSMCDSGFRTWYGILQKK